MTTISVHFSVTSKTSLGEEAYVCGNIPELGNWNTDYGLKLQTNKNIYPQWKTNEPIKIKPTSTLEFKAYIKNSYGALVRWESISGNRTILPKKSMNISFEEGNNKLNYDITPEDLVIETIPYRNNTIEILHDLSDQVSSSSSGNQRQFWFEMATQRKRTDSFRFNNFMNEARKIFQTWNLDASKKQGMKKNNQWQFSAKIKHVIFRKSQSPCKKHKSHLAEATKENAVDKIESVKVHEFSEIEETKESLASGNKDSLRIYHLSLSEGASQFLKITNKSLRDFIVVHMDSDMRMDNLLDEVHVFVVSELELMQKFLNFCSENQFPIILIRDKIFRIMKDNHTSSVLYFDPTFPSLRSIETEKNHPYFSKIEKFILSQSCFELPPHYRVNLLFENQIFKNVRHNKFCIVVNCSRISDIPQRVINNLIGIANRPHLEVYVLTDDAGPEIRSRLAASEKDKMFVLNQSGDVFSANRKPSNIFNELKVNKQAYLDFLDLFRSKIDFWGKNGYAEWSQFENSLQISLKNSVLGKTLVDFLQNQIHKHNESHKMPFQFEHSFGVNEHVVEIKPMIISLAFYCRIIASVNENLPKEPYFFCFDFEKRKCKGSGLCHQMEKICTEKNIKFSVFEVNQEGIDEQTVVSILSKILVETLNHSIVVEPSAYSLTPAPGAKHYKSSLYESIK